MNRDKQSKAKRHIDKSSKKKASGKRIGKSKASKANNQLNRRVK